MQSDLGSELGITRVSKKEKKLLKGLLFLALIFLLQRVAIGADDRGPLSDARPIIPRVVIEERVGAPGRPDPGEARPVALPRTPIREFLQIASQSTDMDRRREASLALLRKARETTLDALEREELLQAFQTLTETENTLEVHRTVVMSLGELAKKAIVLPERLKLRTLLQSLTQAGNPDGIRQSATRGLGELVVTIKEPEEREVLRWALAPLTQVDNPVGVRHNATASLAQLATNATVREERLALREILQRLTQDSIEGVRLNASIGLETLSEMQGAEELPRQEIVGAEISRRQLVEREEEAGWQSILKVRTDVQEVREAFLRELGSRPDYKAQGEFYARQTREASQRSAAQFAQHQFHYQQTMHRLYTRYY